MSDNSRISEPVWSEGQFNTKEIDTMKPRKEKKKPATPSTPDVTKGKSSTIGGSIEEPKNNMAPRPGLPTDKPKGPAEKIEVPVIEPPRIDGTGAEMKPVGDVDAKGVPKEKPVDAATASASKITAQTGTGSQAKAPKDVSAAGYDATKVDPNAAQAEAAQTGYKPKVETALGETPEEAMVDKQMAELTKGLESGNIPLWAQGAVSAVDAQLAARGMSRSSIGQAELTNAIMQAALPMAQQNAQAVQQTNLQNLQNEQTANNLQAQLSTNVELANLSNRQQTVLANQASKQAIMLSNQSADNAAKQFNAQSQNQVNTFMANLKSQTEQFNVAQANAMEQFNTSQVNAAATANAQLQANTSQFNAAQTNGMAQFNQKLSADLNKFNASQAQQADIFNKQNQMVVAQSNAEWRRKVATQNTAMQHEANMQNAQNQFKANQTEMANKWQTMRDQASWAWQSQENALNRETQLIINSKNNAAAKDAAKLQADAAKEAGYADAIGSLVGATIGGLLD